MALRDYLEQRERELLAEMKKIRDEIGARQLQLVPLESELSEIRRCKASVGMTNELGGSVFSGFGTLGPSIKGTVESSSGVVSTGITVTRSDAVAGSGVVAYADLTMKQLVLKALSQHFENGATRRELVDFFRNAWGREVEPASLSPQLSRLAADGLIMQRKEDHRWSLTADGALLSLPIGVV
jgi:hypothetical protein